MNVPLTPELEQFIQSQVKSGKYESQEDVIIAGIQLLAVVERFYKGRVEELPTKGKGWMPGFFEEVIGGWVGEPLVREPQGEYETREPLFWGASQMCKFMIL